MKDAHLQLANRWIRLNNIAPSLKNLFREYSGDHLLGYVYIDHTAGITLDIIKLFDIVNDEMIFQRSPLDDDIRAICRFSDFINAGEILILSDEMVASFNLNYPEKIISAYEQPHLEAFRTSEVFHPFRAEGFPDDIQMLLPSRGNLAAELIWARVEGYENEVLMCQLLNQPHQNFGISINNVIPASLQTYDNEQYVIAHLPIASTPSQSSKKWWKFW
ncbi:hypothetical protein [Kordia sp.]|uniref:hypothetical protein n=1 Tax=Kordia sp. TaxID=1965332 RepID=UPI003D6B8E2C